MTYPAPVIGHWMSTNLLTAAPSDSIAEAQATMKDERIRHLPVVDGGKLLGIVSNRDLDASGEAAAVESAMTPRKKMHTTDAYDSVRAAAELMCREKISALPVLQGEKLVGIVTSFDVVRAIAEQL